MWERAAAARTFERNSADQSHQAFQFLRLAASEDLVGGCQWNSTELILEDLLGGGGNLLHF